MFRAIIVDDDQWVISDILATLQLQKYGFDEVEEYHSAEEALVAMFSSEKKPDLVLSDIRMGDMSGLDMIRICRQRNMDALFVLISAYSDFTNVSEAFQYGVFDYLLKPITDENARRLMLRVSEKLDEKTHQSLSQVDTKGNNALEKAIEYIKDNYTSALSLEEVADACYLSKGYLSMLIKKNMGMSFSKLKNYLRISDAKQLIRAGDRSITEVAYSVGFNDLNYFSRTFKQIVGMTPQEYQKSTEYRN